MRSGERGGGGLTKKGRLTINNTGGHLRSGAGGGELNRKSNRLRPELQGRGVSRAPRAPVPVPCDRLTRCVAGRSRDSSPLYLNSQA